MKRIAISAIRFYQKVLSGLIAINFPLVSLFQCRGVPSCSTYTIWSIEKHGLLHGIILGTKRIASCVPWKPITT
ncbi:MAG: hypothetical protein UX26_C0035G0006 [Parcubacteria group bacterium GW2011_GWC1_45_9]|nr:MAG: hypothetical protein UX26_C0035G0006 [Parcubacteria group bacterium GW2011_GWC1_45_9]